MRTLLIGPRSAGTVPFTMAGGIFLRSGDGLVEMVEQPYDSEDVLQALLADYPALLAGAQADRRSQRWLLLAREAPVGDGEANARWSVDHLFVDQDAIPTIVEVKRSSDTRIRREVVGQMLEYAANAVTYWRADELRGRCEAAADARGVAPDDLLQGALGVEDDPDDFWEQFKTNLTASKVRLVFVADEIPAELRRLVEFLNEQLLSAEVLALEVKQYVDAEGRHQTLVPRLVGRTEKAQQAKSWTTQKPPGRRWDRRQFLDALARSPRGGPDTVRVAEKLFAWAERSGYQPKFGIGQKDASVGFPDPSGTSPFLVYTYANVEMQFQSLRWRAPFDRDGMREELRRRLNEIPGVSIPGGDRLKERPSFDLAALSAGSASEAFLSTVDWVYGELAQARPEP